MDIKPIRAIIISIFYLMPHIRVQDTAVSRVKFHHHHDGV